MSLEKEIEMAQMTAILVHAAGGKIRITPKHMQSVSRLKMVRTQDHATGDVIFNTDEDIQAFDDSFKEQKT